MGGFAAPPPLWILFARRSSINNVTSDLSFNTGYPAAKNLWSQSAQRPFAAAQGDRTRCLFLCPSRQKSRCNTKGGRKSPEAEGLSHNLPS